MLIGGIYIIDRQGGHLHYMYCGCRTIPKKTRIIILALVLELFRIIFSPTTTVKSLIGKMYRTTGLFGTTVAGGGHAVVLIAVVVVIVVVVSQPWELDFGREP